MLPFLQNKVFIIGCAVLLLIGCTSQSTLHDSEGNPIRLADYHGKWIVINYWSTWCQPCFKEVPELNAFYAAHKDNDAMLFGVNYDHASTDKLPQLVHRMGIRFPTLRTDPAAQFGITNIPGLPITFLIGPDGKLKKVLLGEQTQESLESAMGLVSPLKFSN